MTKEEIQKIIRNEGYDFVDDWGNVLTGDDEIIIDDDGIEMAAQEILERIENKIPDNWERIGKNKRGEMIYQNKKGKKKLVGKDFQYLIYLPEEN